MSKIRKKDSIDDKNINETVEITTATTTTAATAKANNYQRVSERVQQWNRAIPEAGYIQLGTLRYGVRLSNPNLSQYSNTSERQSVNSLQTQSSNLSLNPAFQANNNESVISTCNDSNCSSNNSSSQKSRCCCSNLTMPWTSHSPTRTRLPVPMQGTQAKNRTSSPSSSSSSSLLTTTPSSQHQHQQQRTTATAVCSNTLNLNRDTSPTSVCCYNTTSSNSNKNSFLNFNSAKQHPSQEKLKKPNNNLTNNNNNNNNNYSGKSGNRKIFRSESFGKKTNEPSDTTVKNARTISGPPAATISTSHVGCCSLLGYGGPSSDDQAKLTKIRNKIASLDLSNGISKNDVNSIPLSRHCSNNDEYLFSCDYFPPNGCNKKSNAITSNNNNDSNLNKNQLITSTDNNLNLLNCFQSRRRSGCVTAEENSTSSPTLNEVFQEELYNLNLSLTENLESINKSKQEADPNYHKRSLPTLNKTESDNRLASLRKYSEDLISLKALQRYNASCERSSPGSPTSPSTVVIRKLTPKLPKKSLNFGEPTTSPPTQDTYNFGVVAKKTLSITPSPEEGEEYKFPTSGYFYHPDPDNQDHLCRLLADEESTFQQLLSSSSSSFGDANTKVTFHDEDFSYIDSGDVSSTSDDVNGTARRLSTGRPLEALLSHKQSSVTTNNGSQCKINEISEISESFDANRKKFELLSDVESEFNQVFPTHQHRKSFSSPSSKYKYEKIQLDGVDSAKYTNKLKKNSADNLTTGGLNCFGSRTAVTGIVSTTTGAAYANQSRLSPEKTIIMEKRRNTLDRLQRLGFGRRLNANNENKNDKSNSKTERLKELTELLKGTSRGTQPTTALGSTSTTSNDPVPAPPPPPPPPPIPPPRRPRKQNSLDQSSSSSSNSELKAEEPTEPAQKPAAQVSEPKATTKSKLQKLLRPNVSASNLDSYTGTGKAQQQPYDPSKSISLGDDELFTTTLSRPESRAIVGSYTQKTIPFRSASFSQVDYSSGKYIRAALGTLKNSLMKNKNSNSVVDSTNCTLPRKKEDSEKENLRRANSEEPKYLLKSELSINLQDYSTESLLENHRYPEEEEDEEEPETVKRNSDIDTIEEEPSSEAGDCNDRIQDRLVQASEMILEPLVEEEYSVNSSSPTQETVELQKATTCLIPVPVYEGAVPEWIAPNREQMWINATEDEHTQIEQEVLKRESDDVRNTLDDKKNVLILQSSDELSNDVSVDSMEQSADLENALLDKIEIIERAESKLTQDISTDVEPDPEVGDLPQQVALEIAETAEQEARRSNVVSIVCSESDLMPSDVSSVDIMSSRPESTETQQSDVSRLNEFVEVRKRHSNNDNYLVATDRYSPGGSPITTPTSPNDEKRRIDKSRRRKGIYIQWPAIDKNNEGSDSNENSTPEDVRPLWQCEKIIADEVIEKESDLDLSYTDLSTLKVRPLRKSVDESNLSLVCKRNNNDRYSDSRQSLEPTTPDSDPSKLSWPKGNPRRQSLTYQSSDEKDETGMNVTSPVTVRPFKNIFLRSDSVSDNESERGSSRDRASASPAPQGADGDLRRYSKRPLRGPYGQMLEAEMKKPTSKVQYDELLNELSKNENSNRLSPANRSRNNSSQSFDDSNAQSVQVTKASSKSRKSNAQLPVPMHTRTASSPSQLLVVSSSADSPPIIHSHKRFPSSVDQRSLELDKNVKNDITKKLSLDSNSFDKSPKRTSSDTSDKHSKRTSSGASDKKRSLDEIRLSTRTNTGSERNFILNTPDTPKLSTAATPELLAELLKGSSEKLVNEQLQVSQSNISLSSSQALPTAVLKCLDTRTHVVVELFNTEQSYVESLQTVVLKYLNPLKSPENAGIVDAQLVDEIFFMVPAILNTHERFLDELRRRLDSWDALQKVGDAFVEVFSKPTILETYTAFVNNWNKAKDAIRLTKTTRPAFARFLETMAREHKGKLSLDNLLIKPVQKFPNYELIFSRLIKHTDVDHPDQKPLQDALKLVHDILLHLNCKEKEALANGQREATLRELEGVIEGISDLVTSDRLFLLFDLVSMPTSGQATRKERGFFLFNDLLVITSIKRRSGTIRKPSATCPGSVACTLDTNKYKFLTKLNLDELEIIKSKDENLRKIMKEIEQLNEDCNKLQQISDMSTTLRCPHQLLEDAIRELQRENQRQLNERQSNDTQLSLLELMLNSSNGIQNMSIVFSKPEKRTQWEEAFNEAKQKLAASLERHPVPEFMVSVPIRKTRAGLQFTCAAPTLGVQRDVWVCNSDGYVGQVCVLSLQPEPTVTSCNGVCNARILCVSSVPANIESSTTSTNTNSNVSIAIEDTTRLSRNSTFNSSTHSSQSQLDNNSKKTNDKSSVTDVNNKTTVIRLDSGSSSEESETESQPEQRAPSPAISTAAVATTITPSHKQQDSNTDESEPQQSTMWLGTEDGCIHVYNCTDNIRIKKNKIKIQHISAVYSILYLDNRVFASLANGDLCIYSRDHNGWNTTSPLSLTIGTVTSPVTKLLNVYGKIWCAIQGVVKVLNTQTLSIENQLQISTESKPITNMTVLNNFVWISVQNSANVKCFHSNSYELVFEVNLAPSVNKMLSNCDDIIRQHKAACLRVTSLLACKDLIWVGTSAGVLLTISGQNVYKTGTAPQVTGIPHGHTGHVRFLTFVETDTFDKSDKKFPGNRNSAAHNKTKSELANILVISGGDGYEDFRGIGNNPMGEIAGREDSTNHLLLWQV